MNTLLNLDQFRLTLKGHFREAADAIVEKFDIYGYVSKGEYNIALGIIRVTERGKK